MAQHAQASISEQPDTQANMTFSAALEIISDAALEWNNELGGDIHKYADETDAENYRRSMEKIETALAVVEASKAKPGTAKPDVLLYVSGDVVQDIEASAAIDVTVIDYDTDDCDSNAELDGEEVWLNGRSTDGETSGYAELVKKLKPYETPTTVADY